MPGKKLSHLTLRGPVYWGRFPVPSDLRVRLKRAEWKFSLKTRVASEAKVRCHQAALIVQHLHSTLRAMPSVSDTDIAGTAKAYLEWALRHAVDGQRFMTAGPFIAATPEGPTAAISIGQLADGSLPGEEKAAQELLTKLRSDLAAGRCDWALKPLAREFGKQQGFDLDNLDEDTQISLLHAIQRARVEEARIRLAMLQGDYAATGASDPLFQGIVPPLRANWLERKPASGPTLSAAIERFRASKTNAGQWVGKTQRDHQRVMEWLCSFHDAARPLSSITMQDIREFVDVLDLMPANFIKEKKFQGKTLSEVVASLDKAGSHPRLGQATKAKYFSKLKSFFGWCEDQGYGPSPVGKITVEEPKNETDQRHPFKPEQLQAIFHSPQYTGHSTPSRRTKAGQLIIRDGKFWIPLIGLCAGMRLGEIVQLRVSDVRQEEGIWCFDIAWDEEDEETPKNIKTEAAVRLVPVHPLLREIGLLEYHREMQQKGERRLFPDIKPGKDGYYSHNFSKYFSRHLKALGVKTKKTSFHSLRHNFGDSCDRADLSRSNRDALMGHKDDSTGGRYRAPDARVDILWDCIQRLQFRVDLSHLTCAERIASRHS